MRTVRLTAHAIGALVLATGLAAQTAVTAADIGRLDTTIAGVEKQIAALQPADRTLATEATKTLDELRDETTYLRVKLRRDGNVAPSEYAEIRDRLETLRVRVQRQQRVSAQPVLAGDPTDRRASLPVGTELDV